MLRPVTLNHEGSYQGETKLNVFLWPTISKNSDSLRNTHCSVEDWIQLGEMKLNEPGNQKLGRRSNKRLPKRFPFSRDWKKTPNVWDMIDINIRVHLSVKK